MDLYEHAVEFIENLTLVGDYGGEPVVLRPWQKQILKALLKTQSGRRIVSKCLILLPRKNGKTFLIASLCLFFLMCGGKNQEIISAASSEKQARLVFNAMREIIENDPELDEMLEIIPSAGRIVFAETNSFYVAVSSGGAALHGLSPTTIIMDEIHAFDKPRHQDLYAALTTGSGARKNPLIVMISTQTAERGSLAHTEFEYARQIRGRIENGKVIKSGSIDNPSYLSVLYYADPDKHDWTDKTVHRLVNPAYGDFLQADDLDKAFKLALDIPSQQQSFKQFRLNMMDASSRKWMDMSLWDKCKGDLPDDLTRYKCLGAGLDCAPVHDLSALSLLFDVDGKIAVLPFAWCNDEDIETRTKLEGVPYRYWQEQGFIKLFEGSSTDYEILQQDVLDICEKYRVPIVGADMQKGFEIGQFLSKHGVDVQWVKPYFPSMSPPMMRLEKLVIDQKLLHAGHPVLDYCVGNVIPEYDGQKLIRPSNRLRRDQDKIDLAVSTMLALAVSMTPEPEQSVYETRGVFVV